MRRGHDKAWKDFVRWTRGRGIKPLPANPWAVAAFLRWCERHNRSDKISECIKAIARAHLINSLKSPDSHPMVTRTIRLIEMRSHTRLEHSDLFSPDDFVESRKPLAPEAKKPCEPPAIRRGRIMTSTPKLVSRRR